MYTIVKELDLSEKDEKEINKRTKLILLKIFIITKIYTEKLELYGTDFILQS